MAFISELFLKGINETQLSLLVVEIEGDHVSDERVHLEQGIAEATEKSNQFGKTILTSAVSLVRNASKSLSVKSMFVGSRATRFTFEEAKPSRWRLGTA